MFSIEKSKIWLTNFLFLYLPFYLLTFEQNGLQAQDYEPVQCVTAMPYKGPPLHSPLDDEIWMKFSIDLSGQMPSGIELNLDALTDEILGLTGSPAISAAIGIPGKGLWSVSKGTALRGSDRHVDSTSYFHWASVGKAFTATAVIQLIEANKLGYEDPLANWFPDFPNAGAITIGHLLTHTSGIFSFNSDLPFREERDYKTPLELLGIAQKHGNAFCPGEYWAYSNTNYVLLALILEKIEHKPFHLILTERIIEPLALTHTIALAPRQKLPGLVKGHTAEGPEESFEETTPFGAGIIVASAGDMIRFWHAFLSGKLISPASVKSAYQTLYQMFQPGIYYGRGVMLYDVKNDAGERVVWWLGHSGGTPGLKTIIACDIESGIYVAVALNNPSSAEASANKLMSEVKALLK